MKSLSKHLQESLNEESKTLVDITGGNREDRLGLPENKTEETVAEKVANQEVVSEEATTKDVVTEDATIEKEKPSE